MSLLRLSFARSLNILIKSPITTQKLNNVCNNTFLKSSFVNSELNKRFISLTSNQCCQEEPEKPEEQEEPVKRSKYSKPGRDRSQELTVETSIEYLASEEYKQTYGDNVVWHGYRRVHKGGIAPKKTRESCIRFKVVTTSSPCPICRDEYLLLDHRNLELLKQFISPHTGEVVPYSKTGLCQKQHRNLVIALERAYDLGLVEFQVPFRHYDYSLYYDFKKKQAID